MVESGCARIKSVSHEGQCHAKRSAKCFTCGTLTPKAVFCCEWTYCLSWRHYMASSKFSSKLLLQNISLKPKISHKRVHEFNKQRHTFGEFYHLYRDAEVHPDKFKNCLIMSQKTADTSLRKFQLLLYGPGTSYRNADFGNFPLPPSTLLASSSFLPLRPISTGVQPHSSWHLPSYSRCGW
jgi:hypothetical protein